MGFKPLPPQAEGQTHHLPALGERGEPHGSAHYKDGKPAPGAKCSPLVTAWRGRPFPTGRDLLSPAIPGSLTYSPGPQRCPGLSPEWSHRTFLCLYLHTSAECRGRCPPTSWAHFSKGCSLMRSKCSALHLVRYSLGAKGKLRGPDQPFREHPTKPLVDGQSGNLFGQQALSIVGATHPHFLLSP